jgi:hypothetical protein
VAVVAEVRERDGTVLEDIAGFCMDKQLTRRLNRPSSFSFRVPSYMVNEIQADGYPLLTTGRRQISVELDSTGGLFFHGIVWSIEEDGDEDMVYSRVTCYDPMMLWRFRPARDDVGSWTGDAGNLSDPSFIQRNKFGGPIMEEILTASESPTRIIPGGPGDPSLAEGPLWIDLALSTFTGGGSDLSGAPTNWPMSIAEVASMLTNTGELDIVLTPVIGSLESYTDEVTTVQFMNMATLATYTGNYGTDRTGTVHFDYATGDYNARLFRRSESMDTICNKLYYYLGQRLDQQHWRSNVTGYHPDFGAGLTFLQLLLDINQSRRDMGVFMLQSIYDNFGMGSGDSTANPDETSFYPLFLRQWQVESLLRKEPRQMHYFTPVRSGTTHPQGGDVFEPGDFDIGDLVAVNVGSKARLASAGAQRVYAYTIDIDDDGVEALGEIETSPDQNEI